MVCFIVALASQKEREQRLIILHVLTSFLVSLFPSLSISCVGCKTLSPGQIYGLSKYVLIRELTRRNREVIDFTRSRVKNKA